MKHRQSPGHRLDLQKIGKNIEEVAMQLEVTQTTLYRAIKKLNYTYDVFNSDEYVRRVLCVYLSEDGAKQIVDFAGRAVKMIRRKDIEIETLKQEVRALESRIVHLTVDPAIFEI